MKFKVGTHEFDINDDAITKAITEKSAFIELTADAVVRTQDEDNRFVENMKKEARKEGIEIAVKKTRDTMGLSFEGKTIDNLISAVTDKVKSETGASETDKVTKLEGKVKEKDTALQLALKRAEDAETSSKALKSSYKIDKALDSYIPKDVILPIDDVKTILKSKLRFSENETGAIEVFDTDGNQIKNKQTSDALPVKDVIENFFRDNVHYVKGVEGGGDGGDSSKGNNGKLTIEKFNETMSEKGYPINSPEYSEAMNKAIADKTLDLD